MLSMTSRPTTSKVLLLADGRAPADRGLSVPVRRFRLARVLPEYRASLGLTQWNRRA
jgi:hypothetical protein